MNINTLKKRFAFNSGAYGIPEFSSLDDEYFIRSCIANHLSDCHEEYCNLLNDNQALPQKDSLSYDEVKEIYDSLGDVSKDRRYNDVIEKFSFLYEHPLHGRKLTVGYNVTGQEFFDTIAPFKNVIEEFFFSFTHRMPQTPLDYNTVYESLQKSYQYDIPANLLLNMKEDNDIWEKQIEDAMKVTKLQTVSVMSEEMGHKIKEKYPHLKIHISTHGAGNLDPNNLDAELIDAVNIDEPEMYGQQSALIDACISAGVKIKFIVNRDCMLGRFYALSQFAGRNIKCCRGDHAGCFAIRRQYPWLSLATTAIYKEQVLDSYASYLKLSTRELNNRNIYSLLKYWTSCAPTEYISPTIRITPKNHDVFLDWIKLRKTCSGNCYECRKCEEIYNKLTSC